MNASRVRAIYRKDVRDALRDSRLIMALVMPLLIGLLYSFMFQDESRPGTKLGVVSAESTVLPDAIRSATEQLLVLTVVRVPDEAALRRQIHDEDIDIGLILPGGFDSDLSEGRSPLLTVVLPPTPSFGADYVAATLDRVTQNMADQPPAAVIRRVVLPQKPGSTEAVLAGLGARKTYVLISIILMLGMIAVYALPSAITEETEKKTLEALILIASPAEVVAAKALFGLTYCILSVPLMLAVTRTLPEDVFLFTATLLLSSVTLVGFGLLLGGVFRTQTQLNTWSSLMILPLLAPAVTIGLPTPAFVNVIVFLIPTAQTMRLAVNAFSGEAIFGGQVLSVVILVGWSVIAYGLVWWRLSRQENS